MGNLAAGYYGSSWFHSIKSCVEKWNVKMPFLAVKNLYVPPEHCSNYHARKQTGPVTTPLSLAVIYLRIGSNDGVAGILSILLPKRKFVRSDPRPRAYAIAVKATLITFVSLYHCHLRFLDGYC